MHNYGTIFLKIKCQYKNTTVWSMDVSEFHSNDGTEVMYIYVIKSKVQL